MKKSSKLLFLFSAYLFLMIVDGCSPDDDFNCGNSNYIPFFDFKTLDNNIDNSEIFSNQNLAFEIVPTDIEYLAYQNSLFSFGLINTAYACSPLQNGEEGLKYPIEKIEVFSNQDFNNSLTAGTPLNEIVKIDISENSRDGNFLILHDLPSTDLQFNYNDEIRKFIIETPPNELNIEHQLTVVIYKSNGEQIETILAPVIWK